MEARLGVTSIKMFEQSKQLGGTLTLGYQKVRHTLLVTPWPGMVRGIHRDEWRVNPVDSHRDGAVLPLNFKFALRILVFKERKKIKLE
jgi:hypothetical protein